jgi:carbamoyltransferase
MTLLAPRCRAAQPRYVWLCIELCPRWTKTGSTSGWITSNDANGNYIKNSGSNCSDIYLEIVGYFNNRMEFGARALGNRSILANPCNPNIKEIINIKIKRRENFRPFAPAIIYEEKHKWFNNSLSNPYMSNVENIIENQRIKIPAVTHIDGTGRVQTVTKDINIDFYNLISEFYKLSNVPILLNTSFNENEPIVMSYKNAIECFIRTKMDVLVLNNFIIER